MQFNEDYYKRFKDGSTILGGENDSTALTSGRGPVGIDGQNVIRFQPDQPSIIFGGAGSGKLAQLGAFQLVHPINQSFFILDVGHQYMSTSWHYNLAMGREAYAINPQGGSLYPDLNHPVDLFSILREDAQLFENCRSIAMMALTENEKGGDNAWVLDDAMRWLIRLLIALVYLSGHATPKNLWRLINELDADNEVIKNWGRSAEGLPFDVQTTFIEIYRSKTTSEKHYSAVMGKIKSDLDWLTSEKMANSISGEADYLRDLGDPNKKVGIYLGVTGGTTKEMESFIRLVVGIAQLHCVRAMKGALPLFYIEEAAALGKADFINKAVSEYRKYFQTVLVYQSLGQINKLFGKAGAQEILDSCGMQIFLGGGIRSYDSAKQIADTVGKATINVDTPFSQLDCAYRAENALWNAYWQDQDLFDALRTYEHESAQSLEQRQVGRYAIEPSELMRLTDPILVLSPGKGLQPILAHKLLPYWKHPMMAGRYGPDPLFPPVDRVSIRRRFFGQTTRKFIRTAVPEHLAHMPNHSNGQIAYVEGYRTW